MKIAMQEMQQILVRETARTINPTAIQGLTLFRSDKPRSASVPLLYAPMVCVMAQGEKEVVFGNRRFHYTTSHYLLSSVELSVCGTALHAAPGQPYLSLSLELDLATISEMAEAIGTRERRDQPVRGLALGLLDPSLIDCFTRLLRLLRQPKDIEHLAPLMKREIYYRLLRGENGSMLRQVCGQFSRTVKITDALRHLRTHFREPFSAERLAKAVNVSVPSLNRHFRVITGMSPLQCQKQIRLQEARRLLLLERKDAASAAFEVGYASPSQFNREYTRTFGFPPISDVTRSRKNAEQAPIQR